MTSTETFTKSTIAKALKAAGIQAEVTGRGADFEVVLQNDRDCRAFQRKVCKMGGYRTGWGGWHLKPNYVSQGDWNKPYSRWHY